MDYVHEIDIYVRFSETDAAGHVNNVSYFFYFEEARTKFFKIVCPERNDALNFILASITCDYISQAYAGQELKLYTYVTNVGGKSFTIGHTLSDKATGIEIAKTTAITVCFNYAEQKTIEIPNELRQNLTSYLQALPK
ncbi:MULTISPECIES: acyl-CoA thioesterase [Virgibacillus]|uniref:Thioesterase n=1 Tax=Virgibacillus kapii TaxID=1638645 RepID=A0ABQ2DTP2_9BACI|nr:MULTISPECIES: thioesterase family protein [Virgibacillus]EQB37995.1 hypothetical protein M948_05345 [Virgibacillus sp. CM-4]MYL40713.1 acyl-CoA thioesterase [Virgibacillus massiliensis]GGJ72701.1 thioesterase [Virgibacillus kapii]